jgi:hypothetical protein
MQLFIGFSKATASFFGTPYILGKNSDTYPPPFLLKNKRVLRNYIERYSHMNAVHFAANSKLEMGKQKKKKNKEEMEIVVCVDGSDHG